MNAFDIFIRVFSNCLLLAVVLTFMPAFEPERKKLVGRFFYIFARYAIAPGLLLALAYWFVFGKTPHE
jgi:hypothetical protein